jgi:hypothetical protein
MINPFNPMLYIIIGRFRIDTDSVPTTFSGKVNSAFKTNRRILMRFVRELHHS